MENEQALVTVTGSNQVPQTQTEALILSISELKNRRNVILQLLREIMANGVHYGVIPGTQKPSLLKAGAELICSTFRLAPRYEIEREDLGEGHRSYSITTTLYHVGTQAMWGQGVGSCSTMERKYRYVKGEEHPNIEDTYNTVLKMAKKRSLVDAILTATAASDMFNRRDEAVDDDEDQPSEDRKLKTESQPQHLNEGQLRTIQNACETFKVPTERLEQYLLEALNIEAVTQIPASKYNDILAWVKQQRTGK